MKRMSETMTVTRTSAPLTGRRAGFGAGLALMGATWLGMVQPAPGEMVWQQQEPGVAYCCDR